MMKGVKNLQILKSQMTLEKNEFYKLNPGLFDLSDEQLFSKFIALPSKIDRIIISISTIIQNMNKIYSIDNDNSNLIHLQQINLKINKSKIFSNNLQNNYTKILSIIYQKIKEIMNKLNKSKNERNKIKNTYMKNLKNKIDEFDELLSIIHSNIRRRYRETLQLTTNLKIINDYSDNFKMNFKKSNTITLTNKQIFNELNNYVLDVANFLYRTLINTNWITNNTKSIPRFNEKNKKNKKNKNNNDIKYNKSNYWFSILSKPTQIQNWTYKMFSNTIYYNLIKKKKIKIINDKILDKDYSITKIDEKRKFKYDYYYTNYKQTNKPNSIIILSDKSVLELEDKEFKNKLIDKFPDYMLIQKSNIKSFHDDELIFSIALQSYVLYNTNPLLWKILKYDNTMDTLLRFANCSVKFVLKEILTEFENICKQLAITELLGFETMFGFTTTEQKNQRISLENDVKDLVSLKDYEKQKINDDIYDMIIFDYDESLGVVRKSVDDILNKNYLRELDISDYNATINYYTDGSSGKNKVGVYEYTKTRSIDNLLNKEKYKSITKTELMNCYGQIESKDGIDYVYKKSERLKIRIIFAGNLNTYYPMSRLTNIIIKSMSNQLSIYPLINYDKRNLFSKIGSLYMNKNLLSIISNKEPEYIFLSVDFSSFDHDIKFETITKILRKLITKIGSYVNNDIRLQMISDIEYIERYNTKVFFDKKEFEYHDGMLSGWKVTNSIESILNVYFCSLCIKDMNELVDHIFTSGMGDDNSTILKRKKLNNEDSAEVINKKYKSLIESYGFTYNEKKSYPSYFIFEWLKQIFSADEMKDYGFRAWCSIMFRQPTSTITSINLNELMMLASSIYEISPSNIRLNDCIRTVLLTSKVYSYRTNVEKIINGDFEIKNNTKYIYKINIDVKNTKIYNVLKSIIPDIDILSNYIEKIFTIKSINEEQVIIKKSSKVDKRRDSLNLINNLSNINELYLNNINIRPENFSNVSSQYRLKQYFSSKLQTRFIPSISDYNLQKIIDEYIKLKHVSLTKDELIDNLLTIGKNAKYKNNEFKDFYGKRVCLELNKYLCFIVELRYKGRVLEFFKYKNKIDELKISYAKRPNNSYLYKKYTELFKQNFNIMFLNDIKITKNMINNAKTKIGILSRITENTNFDD